MSEIILAKGISTSCWPQRFCFCYGSRCPSFLVGWVSRCCSPIAASLGMIVSSAMVLVGAPPSMFFCDGRSPVTLIGISPEGWTGVLASACWAALEPVPAGLSTTSVGPSSRTAISPIIPNCCYFSVAFHTGGWTWSRLKAPQWQSLLPSHSSGTSNPRKNHGCAWPRVFWWTHLCFCDEY
jgi:hypothetical protein